MEAPVAVGVLAVEDGEGGREPGPGGGGVVLRRLSSWPEKSNFESCAQEVEAKAICTDNAPANHPPLGQTEVRRHEKAVLVELSRLVDCEATASPVRSARAACRRPCSCSWWREEWSRSRRRRVEEMWLARHTARPLLYTDEGKSSGREASDGDDVLTDGQADAPTYGLALGLAVH